MTSLDMELRDSSIAGQSSDSLFTPNKDHVINILLHVSQFPELSHTNEDFTAGRFGLRHLLRFEEKVKEVS